MTPMTTLLRNIPSLLTPTPQQVTGPFYPGDGAFRLREDLTNELTQGKRVFLQGDVRDQLGFPVMGARVRIWQACASGRYNDERDSNPSPLDPAFGYWGLAITDDNGHFSFRTVVPGEYKDTETWTRPPHIHFRVNAPGFLELTSQMYFEGHPLNEKDLILEGTPREEWERLVVRFEDGGAGYLDIVLQEDFP